MADSDITVSELALSSGIGHNLAKWSFTDPNIKGLQYLSLDAVELHAAPSNNRALATKIHEGRDKGVHLAPCKDRRSFTGSGRAISQVVMVIGIRPARQAV